LWETKLGEKKHKEITSIREIVRKVEKILMLLKVEIKIKIMTHNSRNSTLCNIQFTPSQGSGWCYGNRTTDPKQFLASKTEWIEGY